MFKKGYNFILLATGENESSPEKDMLSESDKENYYFGQDGNTNFQILRNSELSIKFCQDFLIQAFSLNLKFFNLTSLYKVVLLALVKCIVKYNAHLLTTQESIEVLYHFLTAHLCTNQPFYLLRFLSSLVTDPKRLVYIGVAIDTRFPFGKETEGKNERIDPFPSFHLLPLCSFINRVPWLNSYQKLLSIVCFAILHFCLPRYSDFTCIGFKEIREFFLRGHLVYNFRQENYKKHNREIFLAKELLVAFRKALGLNTREFFPLIKEAFRNLKPGVHLSTVFLVDCLTKTLLNNILVAFSRSLGLGFHYTFSSFRDNGFCLGNALRIPEVYLSHLAGHENHNCGQFYTQVDVHEKFIPNYSTISPAEQRYYSLELFKFRSQYEYQYIFYKKALEHDVPIPPL